MRIHLQLAISLALACCLPRIAPAQGLITFNNLANENASSTATNHALVFLSGLGFADGTLLNQDVNFALLVGASRDNLDPIRHWLLNDGSAAGIAVGGGHFGDPSANSYEVSGIPAGGMAWIQVQAWTGTGTFLHDAQTSIALWGEVTFQNPTGGGGLPPASLTGMPALVLDNIPEPCTFALAAVSAAAFLLLHRRRDRGIARRCFPECGGSNMAACGIIVAGRSR